MTESLVELLRQHAEQRPQAEALVQGARRVRYGELWLAAAAVARQLREHGLQSGDRVCLLLDGSPEYVASYYGILAAGGVVVALNTAAKARDLVGWIGHCGARFLIHGNHPELAATLRELPAACRPIDVQSLAAATADNGSAGVIAPAQPDALAAIIYTSGTTGDPKGVMLSHRNLVSNVLAVASYLRLTPADRVLHALPFYYSYGNSVLHTHLAAGASVVIESSLVYPHRVLARMVEERVTGFSGVPATYSLLLSRTQLDTYPLDALRYLTQAGGAMSPADIVHIRSLLPQVEFFVMYGQTEATSRLAYLPPERLPGKLGAAGVPIADTEIAVLDAEGRPLPVGEVGEICARGPGVMLGYWNNPAATAQVLRDGWLWTGDLGYLDDDGFLYIQGRSSEMIKTGAHRVSPAEIEDVVAELAGVAEVAAAGVPDPLLGQVIKVWLVRRSGARLDEREVLAYCRRSLPNYKVPKQVAFVDVLPKTASGKVRRLALSALETAD
jgi:long-chain acyl-CoA synthetase